MEKGGKIYLSKGTGSYLAGSKVKTGRILRIKEIIGRETKREQKNEDTLGS